MNIAVIGAGISGLSVANLLKEKGIQAEIFDLKKKPGGLIECDTINSVLYHKVGGHVFNSKNENVLKWFWSKFDRETEFLKVNRNAKILLDGEFIGYPLENHIYQLSKSKATRIINELVKSRNIKNDADNFEDFLINTFGNTLCEMYFFPYNKKIWQCDLKKVSLEWLEGKLPTPDLEKIIIDNIFKQKETDMVHSTFYYPVRGGSQFIANRLAEGLNINCNVDINNINIIDNGLQINGKLYEKLIFTGDIRSLATILVGVDDNTFKAVNNVRSLLSHGTSNILCECDSTDLSWLYIPESFTKSHRIIYTGNFSKFNNGDSKRISCTVEFSGKYTEDEMIEELPKLPGDLKPLSSNHQVSSYVIHEPRTKASVMAAKNKLSNYNIYLLGRFAEWEYFNMDTAIASAMSLVENEF